MTPQVHYESRLAHFEDIVRHEERRTGRIADLRLGVFAVGLALALAAWWGHAAWGWLLVPLAAFLALVALHEAAHRRRALALLGVAHYQAGLRRMAGEPDACALEASLRPVDSLYAKDLDLFGRGGLFERLCTARTSAGAQTLADWLLNGACVDTIAARQEAARDVAARPAFRETLALTGGAVAAMLSADDLRRWSDEPRRLGAGWRLPVALGLGGVALAAIPVAALGFPPALLLALAANIVFVAANKRGLAALDRSLEPIGRELRALSVVLDILEREDFSAPLLREQQAALRDGEGQSAAAAIRQLDRMTAAYESYQNQLFIVIALYTLWPYWWGLAIERWRARHRDALQGRWMEALGALEALASLGTHAFEHPAHAWPEVTPGTARFEADALGHPLLPPSQRVCNDVALNGGLRLLMVSGSNMSGKSTLLRSVGLNAVLALAGAPVCATRLAISPLRIGAVIRVEDSIQRGASRFYAEIERFKALLDAMAEPPALLFLADEILHGTNTRDRVAGAQALIAGLLERGALGLVTTHDLALTEFVSLLECARNVHFQDDWKDGKLAFDYRLREGVVTKSNALDLMRAIGLPVPDDANAPEATSRG
jgi:hypothetical protein